MGQSARLKNESGGGGAERTGDFKKDKRGAEKGSEST